MVVPLELEPAGSRGSSAKVVPVSAKRAETAKPLRPCSFLREYRQYLGFARVPAQKSLAYNMKRHAQILGYLAVAQVALPTCAKPAAANQPCASPDIAPCDRMGGNLKQMALSAHTIPSKSP
jgi:hypothetical protein